LNATVLPSYGGEAAASFPDASDKRDIPAWIFNEPNRDMPKNHYSEAKQAKRDKKFREHLAQKNNPVRFALALPGDVVLQDIDWNPDHLEQIAARLDDMKKRWEADDDKRRKKRLAEILEAVKRDGL